MILAINTASSHTTILVAGVEAKPRLMRSQFWPSKNDEAEKLMPTIDRLLSELQLSYQDLSKIYVVKGPGSFTGLRVGVTVANLIAHLSKAELHSFTTFQYWQAQSDLPVVVFAGKKGVYFNGEVVNLDQISQIPAEKVSGDISKEQQEAFQGRYVPHNQKWDEQLLNALSKISSKAEKIVQPYYVKKAAITQSKKVSIFSP